MVGMLVLRWGVRKRENASFSLRKALVLLGWAHWVEMEAAPCGQGVALEVGAGEAMDLMGSCRLTMVDL